MSRAFDGGMLNAIVPVGNFGRGTINILRSLIFFMACLNSVVSWAGRTEVLPDGVYGINMQFGQLDRLSYRYSESGLYEHLDQKNSFSVDASMLSVLDPDAERLIKALDALSPEKLGSKLSLGLLTIQARPDVSFWAPALAFGVNDRWTLGVAVPVIRYINNIDLTRSAHNINEVREAVAGLSPEIDAGLAQLAAVDLREELRETLNKKGYAPLESSDKRFVGDVRLMSLWNFKKGNSSGWQLRSILELPTGPEHNPDDLTDLGAFSNLSLEQKLIRDETFGGSYITWSSELGGKIYAPKTMVKRVPEDMADLLPGLESKERVTREMAFNFSAGSWVSAKISHWISAYVGAEYDWKGAETYTGNQGRRYELLGQVPDSFVTSAVFGVDFSTLDLFTKNKFAIPLMFNYEFTSSVAGRDIEDQQQHLFWLQVFYK